jgi:GDP-L-fucose synthase
MKTLITGGHGLVGSFINFGDKPPKNELDLLNYNQLCEYIEKNNINQIINLAAKVGGLHTNTKHVFNFFIDNLLINLNVLRACQQFNINKSIFLMSTCIFPKDAPLPLQEDSLHNGEPNQTEFGYGYAKRMIDVGIRALKQQYNIDSICFIPCNLFGDNDNYHLDNGHVIPSLIHKCYLAKTRNETLTIWGSGENEREFIYAKDIAEIITITHNSNLLIKDPIIIAPDQTYSIAEIVYTIMKLMNFNGKIYFDKSKPSGMLKKNSSNQKFRQYFPNFKFTPLEKALALTVDYFLITTI